MAPLSDAEQARLNGPGPHTWLFDLAVPGGTLRMAKAAFVSASERLMYRGVVKSFSKPSFGAADYGGNVSSSQMYLDVDDATGEVAARWTARTEEWEGSPATVRQAHPTKAPADWTTRFTGVVDRVEWPELMTPRIYLRVDDSVLKHESPKGYARTTLGKWPDAASDALNGYARVIYGTHDSLGYTGHGFVPLDLIDRTNYVYGPILGRIMGVFRVTANDKLVLPPASWSWTYTARRGTWYTVVSLTTDAYAAIYNADGATAWTDADAAGKQKLVEQTKVAVDCHGLGTSPLGAGFGILIVNPIEQVVHFVENFVIGSWRRREWLTSGRIGDFSALQAFFAGFGDGFKGARVIKEPKAGDSQLQDWLRSFSVDALAMAFWWTDGRLYLRLVPISDPNVYPDGPAVMHEKLVLPKPDTRSVVAETVYEFVNDDNQGKFITNVTARDPSATVETSTKLQQDWGTAQ